MRPSRTYQTNNPNYIQQARQKVLALISFVKKNKKILTIITAVIFVFVVLFNLLPVVSIGGTTLVSLNASARIKEGDTIKLKFENVSVKLLHFTNDVCPIPGKCFGSSIPAAEYTLKIDGKSYATGSLSKAVASKYQVETVSSDYKTYAEVRIVKSK